MHIRVTHYNGQATETSVVATFSDQGGTIGRHSECTLLLPDRHISRIQAEVSPSGAGFILTDRGSVNPVIRNGEPVGKDCSTPLHDGDELRIGDYVLRVEYPAAVSTPGDDSIFPLDEPPVMPTASATAQPFEPIGLSVLLDNRTGAALPDTPGLPGSFGNSQGESLEQFFPLSDTSVTPMIDDFGHGSPGTGSLGPAPADPFVDGVPNAPRELEQAQPGFVEAPSADGDLATAFLEGAGLAAHDRNPLTGSQVLPQLDAPTMRRLGSLLRAMTQAMIDLLGARATLKREMRAEVTVIAPQLNNPLKFTPTARVALALLLAADDSNGFLSADDAVRDATGDLVAHQFGILHGMRAAMHGVLRRFEPAALEKRLAQRSALDHLLAGSRKARLWTLFEELYGEVAHEAEEDFEHLFGREFVRAYEAQVKALKKHKEDDNGQ